MGYDFLRITAVVPKAQTLPARGDTLQALSSELSGDAVSGRIPDLVGVIENAP